MSDQISNELNSFLAELVTEYRVDEKQDGDVTADDLVMATGLDRKCCSGILLNLFKTNQATRHRVRGSTGNPVWAYRKVGK